MKLNFLGRGAAFDPAEGNTSACFREGDRLFLIDCGETVFERLLAGGWLEGIRAADICLTHLHSDHCGSLGSLLLYCHYVLGFSARILLPPGEEQYRRDVTELLRLTGCGDEKFRIAFAGKLEEYGSLQRISYLPTRHSPEVRAFSLVLESGDGAVFYSGDTCTVETLGIFLAKYTQIDQIYMDATTAEYPGNVHLPVRVLANAVPEELKQKVSLMHINCRECMEEGKKLGFKTVELAKSVEK